MPIDFHNEKNKGTYSARTAHPDWTDFIIPLTAPAGKTVADIGCGGGIYSRAWADAGARQVTGVDFSPQMLASAAEHSADYPQIRWLKGDAGNIPLPDESTDIVFERALIHHLNDYSTNFAEAYRLLRPSGYFIIQDRTVSDILQPGDKQHLRGWFFDYFPSLIRTEQARRPTEQQVEDALVQQGFILTPVHVLKETRREYPDFAALADDLRQRTGRSLLHELNDRELAELIAGIATHFAADEPVIEKDFWHIWIARKPPVTP